MVREPSRASRRQLNAHPPVHCTTRQIMDRSLPTWLVPTVCVACACDGIVGSAPCSSELSVRPRAAVLASLHSSGGFVRWLVREAPNLALVPLPPSHHDTETRRRRQRRWHSRVAEVAAAALHHQHGWGPLSLLGGWRDVLRGDPHSWQRAGLWFFMGAAPRSSYTSKLLNDKVTITRGLLEAGVPRQPGPHGAASS